MSMIAYIAGVCTGAKAAAFSSVRNCGYHRRKTSSNSLFNTLVRACSNRCAPFSVHACFALHRLALLLENGDAHGDVEPVDPVFAVRMQIRLHSPHILPSVPQEHHLLMVRQPLRLHELKQPPPRLFLIGLHLAEAL